MKSFFILIFSMIFKFSRLIGNTTDDFYAFKSTILFSVFLSINIGTIIGFYNCLVKKSKFLFPSGLIALLLIIGVQVGLHLFFIKDDRYVLMFNEFSNNKKLNSDKGALLTLLYMFVSVFLLFSFKWLPCG
jgi:hypothetical protein